MKNETLAPLKPYSTYTNWINALEHVGEWSTFQWTPEGGQSYVKLKNVYYFAIPKDAYETWKKNKPEDLHIYIGLNYIDSEIIATFYCVDNVADTYFSKTKPDPHHIPKPPTPKTQLILQCIPAHTFSIDEKLLTTTGLTPAEVKTRRNNWLNDKKFPNIKKQRSKEVKVFAVPFNDLNKLFASSTQEEIYGFLALNPTPDIEIIFSNKVPTQPLPTGKSVLYADMIKPKPPFVSLTIQKKYSLLT